MDKVFAGLLYLWRIFWNAVQLVIVLYVFSRLHARLEIVLVSILGLIYVTIRTIAFGTWHVLATMALGIDKEFSYIRRLTGEDVSVREELASDAQRTVQRTTVKLYIDMAFLALISLVCLYQLFITL